MLDHRINLMSYTKQMLISQVREPQQNAVATKNTQFNTEDYTCTLTRRWHAILTSSFLCHGFEVTTQIVHTARLQMIKRADNTKCTQEEEEVNSELCTAPLETDRCKHALLDSL